MACGQLPPTLQQFALRMVGEGTMRTARIWSCAFVDCMFGVFVLCNLLPCDPFFLALSVLCFSWFCPFCAFLGFVLFVLWVLCVSCFMFILCALLSFVLLCFSWFCPFCAFLGFVRFVRFLRLLRVLPEFVIGVWNWVLLGSSGAPWVLLEGSWGILRASWGVLGSSLGALGCSSGVLGGSWVLLGAPWVLLGTFASKSSTIYLISEKWMPVP